MDEEGVGEREEFLQRAEVDVVCGVYGLCDAEDGVCDGDAAAEEGGVFDVVDAGGRVLAWRLRLESEEDGQEGGRVQHAYYAGYDF